MTVVFKVKKNEQREKNKRIDKEELWTLDFIEYTYSQFVLSVNELISKSYNF